MSMNKYDKFADKARQSALVNGMIRLMRYDQNTIMPSSAGPTKAEMLKLLSQQQSKIILNTSTIRLLNELLNDDTLTNVQKLNVSIMAKQLQRSKKLGKQFIAKREQLISQSTSAWNLARDKNDFQIFQPFLEQMVLIKRKEVAMIGYDRNNGHPYDVFLDEYESGFNVKMVDEIMDLVKTQLIDIYNNLPSNYTIGAENFEFLSGHFEVEKQEQLLKEVLQTFGFDKTKAIMSVSTHPLCVQIGPNDSRLTVTYDEKDLTRSIYCGIHENGHLKYFLGLNPSDYGLPSGDRVGYSFHESMSRFWEINIGRSKPFISKLQTLISKYFPQFKDISSDELFIALNQVQSSLIRTRADELTYHFHIMIRYEIEKKLIDKTLEVSQIPEYWNMMYEKYLGIKPTDHKTGVLQDIQWAFGSFGYFPTYSLGNFFAAQFEAQMRKDIPNFDILISQGDFGLIDQWLQSHIYKNGKLFDAQTLCQKITGEKLNLKYYIDYLKRKYK